MSDSQRERVTEESRKSVADGKPTAIVVQIVAGGAGLNLQHCNRILFLSSHWNPAIVDQAIARAYRMGQRDHVEVHHLLLADDAERNLDRYMAKKHGTKRDVAMAVHEKLFCDSAVDVQDVLEQLDEELGGAVLADDDE
jgi:SNF2 family DNA or RNA helicase